MQVKSLGPTSWRYKLLTFLLGPAVLVYTIYRSIRDGGWRYFSQRLGFNYPVLSTAPILIHCASVGEVNAARPLVVELCKRYQDKYIVISTNTPTAAQLVSKMPLQNVSHVYLPCDYAVAVNTFLNRITPACVLILETEIWPTLFFLTAKKNIPIAIINGRLSDKTVQASKLIRNEYQRSLKNLTLLLTRSDDDRLKFLKIGANKESTHTVGNLKYAIKISSDTKLPGTTIKRPFLLAVSTHDDEEMQLARHLQLLKQRNYLLVIAPRYPDRGRRLRRQFRRENLVVAMRSSQDLIDNDTDIYIVDTLGELDMFFNEAALVFVGGSLIQRGGHNILEPANFGRCVVVGPNMDNFALETKELLKANGILQISDHHELGVKLVRLLNDEHRREQYGLNARKFIRAKAGVLGHYLKYLRPLLN